MNAIAKRSSFSVASAVAAVLMSVSLSAQAQVPESRQFGVYVGGTAGFGLSNWECDAFCDRAVFSGKLFAAKRLTPGLAAEVNYMMFGQASRTNTGAEVQSMGYTTEERSVRAWTFGINWEVELINDFTNQIRLGWATAEQTNDRKRLNGSEFTVKEHFTAPYVGAGLAYRLTRDIKLLSNADFLLRGRRSQYLLSVGASAEF
nr:outer membrane beta-barrel protein [uncultured Aquabacterium sp.]